MTILSGLGIVLSVVFGCLLLALVGELYCLLWWKKQKILSSPTNRIQEDYSNHAKEMFYLFCWDKPTTIINNSSSNNPNGSNPDENEHDPDLEMGLEARRDLLLKALGEEAVDADILKLAGHPRFLFTIKEETKEDLESEDGKSRADKRSRTRSLSDLIMALETQTPYLSPVSSPPNNSNLKVISSNLVKNNNNYNNPLFESSVEAEIYRLRSSPPPKFKFLRDAEEKLYRSLIEEAQKSGIFKEIKLENFEEKKDKFLMKKSNEKEREIHCSSQILPLASSPTSSGNDFSLRSVDSKHLGLH